MVFVRIVVTDASVGSGFYGPAARRIVIENAIQCRDAAVVHVGRGDSDVAECGSFELSYIGGDLCVLVRTGVTRRVREHARDIVKTRIVKLDLSSYIVFRNRRVAEIETAVAAEARKVLVEEQYLSALGGIGHGAVVAAVVIAVVR